jgi:hypothetical protein
MARFHNGSRTGLKPVPHGEPLINVMARFHHDRWQVVLIPRRAHRPSCYFRPEGERILISPGTVDMGGLVITPAEKDFVQVDVDALRSIFQEVSFDDAMVEKIVAAL